LQKYKLLVFYEADSFCQVLHINMSNKGISQSLETRKQISTSNTKDRTELLLRIKSYIVGLTNSDFPSLTRAAIQAGISEKALLALESRTEENSELRIMLDMIRDLSKASLMEGGLKKVYDARMSTFLLQANHQLKTDPPTLNQTNNFNVSPEILAEALDISRDKKSPKPNVKTK
jgi:hypothetical protein